MTKSRKGRVIADEHRPRRKQGRVPAQEPTDRTVEELAWLARISQENPDPVLRVSAAHVLLYRNPAGEELCRAWGCRLGRKVPPAVRALVSTALAEGAVTRHKVTFDSHVYELTVVPSAADGYANIYACDITNCERTQEALRQAQERFRTIFDTTSDGIFLHDLEALKLTMCNRSFLQMLGYTAEEFTKLSVADIHPEADLPFIYAQIDEFLRGGKPIRHDIRFKRKDGSILFADVSPDLVRLDGRRYVVVALKDITERKRMEEGLRQYAEHLEELVEARTHEVQESERKYRSLVEKINDWAWEVDADCVYTYASPRVLELLGYPPEEIVGKTPFDLMPPGEARRVWNAFRPTWLERKPLELLENTLVRKDGRLVTVETSGMPVFAEDGSFRGYTGIDRDVTSRKQAQETLREKEYLLSESQRIGHIGSWSVDLVTQVATWTRETYRLFGVAPEIFVPSADTLIDLLHPDDRAAMREWIRAALAGAPPEALEFRVPLPDGSVRMLIGQGELIYADDHRPIRLVGTVQDVTERVQAQESLQFTQFAIDHTADAAFWMTEDARFFYVNEAACRALGYSREELREMTVYDIDPAFTEKMWRESWRRLKAQKSIVLETVHRAKEGRIYPVEIRANYLEFGGREYDCAFARDITERKRAEEALREWNATLEDKVAQRTAELQCRARQLQTLTLELSQAEDRERKRIADILHDDVQQTLAAAKFHLNLLSTEPRSAEESREIVEQVKRMLRDAIEKSRHLSHELSPALYQVDLTAILEWLARHMQEKHGLTVRVEVHGPADSPAEPLKAFLYKVVQELLFNVVKHAGVREARVRVRRLGPYLYLAVVDRGRGFDPQRLETMPGFGLQAIRERIQLLGGRMKIKSTRGAGSTLLIALPYEAAARAQDTVPAEYQEALALP